MRRRLARTELRLACAGFWIAVVLIIALPSSVPLPWPFLVIAIVAATVGGMREARWVSRFPAPGRSRIP